VAYAKVPPYLHPMRLFHKSACLCNDAHCGAVQTFIDAPNAASGPIPDDVSPFFAGPYYEW
jgi:hypothetical protein